MAKLFDKLAMSTIGILLGTQAGSASAISLTFTDDLSLWLQADVGVKTDISGNVIGWQDQSGLDRHATLRTGNPLLVNNVLNGLPAIRFDGNDAFDLAGQVLTSQQYSIFAVVNDTGSLTRSSHREIISNWTFSNKTSSVFFGTTSNGIERTARLTDVIGGSFEGQQGRGIISNPDEHFIFTGISGISSASVYQNTNLLHQRNSPIFFRNLSTPWVIGAQGNLNREYWVGDIAELLVYNDELNEDERLEVTHYLHKKYFSDAHSIPEPSSVFGIGFILGMGILLRLKS